MWVNVTKPIDAWTEPKDGLISSETESPASKPSNRHISFCFYEELPALGHNDWEQWTWFYWDWAVLSVLNHLQKTHTPKHTPGSSPSAIPRTAHFSGHLWLLTVKTPVQSCQYLSSFSRERLILAVFLCLFIWVSECSRSWPPSHWLSHWLLGLQVCLHVWRFYLKKMVAFRKLLCALQI